MIGLPKNAVLLALAVFLLTVGTACMLVMTCWALRGSSTSGVRLVADLLRQWEFYAAVVFGTVWGTMLCSHLASGHGAQTSRAAYSIAVCAVTALLAWITVHGVSQWVHMSLQHRMHGLQDYLEVTLWAGVLWWGPLGCIAGLAALLASVLRLLSAGS